MNKKDFLVLGLLIVLFLFTRIYHLDKLPIFADEAIYVRWSQVMQAEPSLRFLPLQDGKQPLFMWITIPFLKIFSNPLFAGRIVSVFSGLATFLGVLFLGNLLKFKKHELVLLGLLYIWIPFAFFFERMALVDSMLTAFGVWTFNLTLLLAKTQQLDIAMLLGFALGGGLLTKSPAKIFLGLSVFTIIWQTIIDFSWQKVIKRIGLLLVSLFIAFMMYNILRLGPNFHMIGLRNQDYIWSFSELMKRPFISLKGNLISSWRYYWHYLTWPLFFVSLAGLFKAGMELLLNKKYYFVNLFAWLFTPLFGISLIGKTFTARYILFTLPFLTLFIMYGLRLIRSFIPSKAYFILLPLVFVLPILFNYHLWHNPVKANFPQDERAGYLEDWTAGWGIEEIAQLLKARPKKENILVGTEGYFGTLPDGLQIYIQNKENINVIGVGQPVIGIPNSLKEAREAGNEVYLVVNDSRFKINNPEELGLELIDSYNKPGDDKLLFWKLK